MFYSKSHLLSIRYKKKVGTSKSPSTTKQRNFCLRWNKKAVTNFHVVDGRVFLRFMRLITFRFGSSNVFQDKTPHGNDQLTGGVKKNAVKSLIK